MILTAVDDNFLTEAVLLIKSCARHVPEEPFYLFLVNSTRERIAALRSCHPRLIVEHVLWPYDPERWRGLMCCARSVPIRHVLETYREPTLYLDSDILVMGPLDDLFGRLKSFDLLVKYRPEVDVLGAGGTRKAGKFNSGVIAVRPSEPGLQFAGEYDRRLREWIEAGKPLCHFDEERGVSTCVDQEFLYVIYEEFGDRLKFQPLPDRFNDATFQSDSVIWHGKGSARRHPEYVLAKLSYGNRLQHYGVRVVGFVFRILRRVVRFVKSRRRPREV